MHMTHTVRSKLVNSQPLFFMSKKPKLEKPKYRGHPWEDLKSKGTVETVIFRALKWHIGQVGTPYGYPGIKHFITGFGVVCSSLPEPRGTQISKQNY